MPSRAYAAIHAATVAVPDDTQWGALFAQTKTYPLAAATLAAARNACEFFTHRKRSRNAAQLNRYTLVGFEIADQHLSAIRAIAAEQAAIRSIAEADPQVRYMAVLEAELQDAATDLGYGAQAQNLTVAWFTAGARQNAISAAQAYLAANAGIWYE
jgi:hypothetical protein